METIVIQTEDKEKAEAVRAVLKVLKLDVLTEKEHMEALMNALSVAKGYREMLDVKAGKLEAKDAEELFKEL